MLLVLCTEKSLLIYGTAIGSSTVAVPGLTAAGAVSAAAAGPTSVRKAALMRARACLSSESSSSLQQELVKGHATGLGLDI